MDSVTKNKRGKPLKSGQRKIVRNIYLTIIKDNPGVAIRDIAEKVADSTGISKSSVFNIMREFRLKGKNVTPTKTKNRKTLADKLSDFDKSAIRRKIHSFYLKNELPTVDKVLRVVNDDTDLPNFSRSTFQRVLKLMNFKYVSRKRNSFLIERTDIVLWRRDYLRRIRQYRRENRKIYYLDETWVNAGHTRGKVWVDMEITSARDAFIKGLSTGLKNPTGKGKRLIVTHIGSDTGFLEGGLWIFESKTTREYHEEMNSQAFKEWFTKILEKVESNSIIVMDNAPYHSEKNEKIPNMSYRKQQIAEWLRSKGVIVPEDALKIELLSKVKEIKHNYNTYKIDEIAKSKNCTVLRLPPYHCNLNPIELIWAQVKGFVAAHNKHFQLKDVKNLVEQGIRSVTPDSWKKCISHVIEKEENTMWNVDNNGEETIENFIINLGESSESSETDNTDASLSGIEELG